MVESKGKAAITGSERNIHGHIFYGGHFEYNLERAAKLDLKTISDIQPGKKALIQVNVTNSGCGHALPTGVSEVRELWLDVTVIDSSGKKVFENKQYYKPIFVDQNDEDVGALFWRAVKMKSDNRIAPKETRVEQLNFIVPADITLPLTVNARLLYRLAPQELADKAGVGILEIITLDEAELTIGGTTLPSSNLFIIGVVIIVISIIIIWGILKKKSTGRVLHLF